jgi:heme-degrading monooxygenase HmoA
MYARHVSYTLTPNRREDFIKAFEKDIIPLLQKQNGFADLITLFSPDGKTSVAISLWDRKENAEAFGREVYPGALRHLAGLFEGTPEVREYEVAASTFPKVAAAL